MSKIKVLFPVGALFPDESGGVSISLYWLLKGLNKSKNIETGTVTTNYGIENGKIELNKWIETDYGPVIYNTTKQHKIAFRLIISFISKINNYDIIHLSSIFYPPSIICFFIALLFNKEIIWSTHGSLDDVEFIKRKKLKKISLFILNFFVKKTFFHVTCNEEEVFLRKRLKNSKNIFNITNFISIDTTVSNSKEDFFIYIGRFHPKKGIENLIKSLSLSKLFLKSSYTLQIAGDFSNNYGQYIFSLVNDLNLTSKVLFLGHITGIEKVNILSKAKFMFLPSFSENFGIVVAEALACETPVVTSIYTPWENLHKYEAGFWVDNTPESLASIIDQIISLDSEKYEHLKQNCKKLLFNELDVDNNIHIWENVYKKIYN
ncbi:glycosyltransferase [Runella sp. SP2]|uniref:glycosyltransferase n=1 Tax=Runella sp. SP2 TaxID=2268026 RepID=UPI000F07CCB9|nr:glycosyltransferase [Runella sp. SP2]AYQ30770.1 glycosyltransferase [Runella sp. SP2]